MSFGGGGGNNNMMMAMMIQQQQQAQLAAAQQDAARQAAAQAESARQFDATQSYNTQQSQLAAQQFAAQQQYQQQQAAQQAAAQQQYAQTQADSQRYAIDQQVGLSDRQSERENQLYIQQGQAALAAEQAKQQQAAQQLANWQNARNAAYNSSLNSALSALTGKGDNDAEDADFVRSAYANANAGIADLGNYGAAFSGLQDSTFANLLGNKQSKFTSAYNKLFPTDFATTKVADTTDDDILNAILGDQYNDAQQNATRLRDRGVITNEGYDANIKNLDKQKAAGLGKLTTIGDNELNSERSKLTGIANTGRQAIADFQLGQTFDPNDYSNKVNNAYDTWFKGLDTKLRGLAPTDLFDTSGFLNTAGAVAGPMNSPFVGSTNALTGTNALDNSDPNDKKKQSSSALGTPTMGVF